MFKHCSLIENNSNTNNIGVFTVYTEMTVLRPYFKFLFLCLLSDRKPLTRLKLFVSLRNESNSFRNFLLK